MEIPFSGHTYNEFTLRTPLAASAVLGQLETRNILGGVAVGRFYPDRPNDFLVAVTELHTREHLDYYAAAVADIVSGKAQ